jgi:glycosyltransferase involved in cell wall biosynthesis
MTAPSRPIRVMRIIARLNIGGPAIHVTLLTQKLAPPAYESRLVSGQIGANEGDMRYYAEERGIEPIIIPELGRSLNPIRDLIAIIKLVRLMRAFQPDVVHTHTAKAGFAGRIAARLAGVPVVVHTFHGHVFQGYFSRPLTRLFIILEQIAARLSDTLIVLTEGLRRELSDQYRIARKRKFTVLPLGLDLEPFAHQPRKTGAFRAAYGIPLDAPLIGLVGRLTAVKNHALFLDAAARVRREMPRAHFVIVGDGELRADIERRIDLLDLRGCVTMTGWIKDTAPVYADLDALAISSVNEGTPVTVIEALAVGVPVVATAVGGLPDLLEGGALGALVPSGDAAALAKALVGVLKTPPPPDQLARAQATIIDQYGIDRLVRDLDHLYRALLAKKGRVMSDG